jgi:hypothetical protein
VASSDRHLQLSYAFFDLSIPMCEKNWTAWNCGDADIVSAFATPYREKHL